MMDFVDNWDDVNDISEKWWESLKTFHGSTAKNKNDSYHDLILPRQKYYKVMRCYAVPGCQGAQGPLVTRMVH